MSEAATPEKTDTLTIEIDGVEVECEKGSMIIEAADRIGIDIPRFCYHRKLSIAANCRMCLVDVEKSPKPLPACATPVMDGMKVFTESKRATDAQRGVMEFLLINHPLDCPICDQGGECALQDLAMGYGRSISRFTERKRVVKDKNIGPLVQTDMTRCIHCTRCVRFMEEIAGTAEMGGFGRGENLKIGTFIERSIDSELSGNIIDLCPVGALTNKPFRYSARAWELMARRSVSIHDAIGSNIQYHVKRGGKIMRSVPADNDAVNETWLSDRDRYSHFGLYADDRLTRPEIRTEDGWKTASWDDALAAAVRGLSEVRSTGAENLGMLMAGTATNEEYFLAQKLMRALGSDNIDHRLREHDFSDQAALPVNPGFELGFAELDRVASALLIGCNPRHEAPLLGHKLRKAWRSGATISAINPVDYNLHFDLQVSEVVKPGEMVRVLEKLVDALDEGSDQPLAQQLAQAESPVLILGHVAAAHPQAARLRQLADKIAGAVDGVVCILPLAANAAGAWSAGAVPHRSAGGAAIDTPGLHARAMREQGLKGVMLWDVEPAFDSDHGARMMAMLEEADTVVACASFAGGDLREVADVLLPIAPMAENEGSLTNIDGRVQTVRPAGPVQGEARPGWKVLRVLAEYLGLEGFDVTEVRQISDQLAAAINDVSFEAGQAETESTGSSPETSGFERVGDVPIYAVDALVRRSQPLQKSDLGQNHWLGINPADAGRQNIDEGDAVTVRQGDASTELPARIMDEVPEGALWVKAAGCSTRLLGPAFGAIEITAGGQGA